MQAILRNKGDQRSEPFQAGAVVDVLNPKVARPGMVRVAAVFNNIQHMTWLHPSNILPLSELFKRQPKDDFWVLAMINKASRDRWLQDPVRCWFGDDPFRFESLGELKFWMREEAPRRFDPTEVWIGNLTNMKI